jgi:putative oxidoreductase
MGYCKKSVDKYGTGMFVLFRVLVGLMFFMHGSGKLFGWFGGPAMGFSGLMGFVGVVEFLAGLGILLGFWTRLSALGGFIIMIGALVTTHFPSGWNPLLNGGELAFMYFAAFLVLIVYGSGKFSLEKKLTKKERF